ncbi:hypothetical protein LguiB_025045 [Lonicera macranthoides]
MELEISAFKRVKANLGLVIEVLGAQDGTEFTLDKLKVVEIYCLRRTKAEQEFVKFLLANTPSLKKMCIGPCPTLDAEKRLVIAKELIRFYRTSPEVDFRYLDA